MTKLTYVKLAAMGILFVAIASCSKELSEDPTNITITEKRSINTTATIPQIGDKAYFDETDGRKVKWELTDAINVNGTNIALADLHYDATKAKFEGTTYAIVSGGNDIYWAVYPTDLAGAASGSSIPSNFTASTLTVNLPNTQDYNSSANALSGNTYMAGYVSVPSGEDLLDIQMRNIGSVLKLHLSTQAGVANTHANKLVFSTTDGALAGVFTVNNNATNPVVTSTASATKTLTVNLTDGTHNYIDIASGADVYVILPPFTSKNLTMRIYNTDGNYTEKTAATATFARSYIYHNTVTGIDFSQSDDKYYFSVASGTKVVFSPGNLQWSATDGGTIATTHRTAEGTAAGTWRFAEHQWNKVGFGTSDNTGNVYNNNNVKSNNASIDEHYDGWIDLFGFGTSGYNSKNPWKHDNTSSSYGNGSYNLDGTYYDFGVYNDIYNPKTHRIDAYGTWRLLTMSEWTYVFGSRTNAANKRGTATVEGVTGYVLLPDYWTLPTGLTFRANNSNNYTLAQWALMEENGAVFLPKCGNRNGTSYNGNLRYATSSKSGDNNALYGYEYNYSQFSSEDPRRLGASVRLVKPYTGN